MTAPDSTVLVPVGMPLGMNQGSDGGQQFGVRLGRDVYALDDERLGAWFLARAMRADRAGLIAAMRSDGLGDPATPIDSLIAGKLLAPVDSTAESAVLFFARYTMVPLMTGLGGAGTERFVGVPGRVEYAVPDGFFQVFCRSTSTRSILEVMQQVLDSGPQQYRSLRADHYATALLSMLGDPLLRGMIAFDLAAEAAA